MKVTSSSKVKVMKILSGTVLLLTLLIGSFVLGGVYLSKESECQCKKLQETPFLAETKLEFLKASPLEVEELKQTETPTTPPPPPVVSSTAAKVESDEEEEEEEEKVKQKQERQQRRRQERRKKPQQRQQQKSTNLGLTPEKLFRSMNIPNLLRNLERATDEMAERIMERNRRNRIACIMARRQEDGMDDPRARFFLGDDEPRRRLIVSPDGNNLLDCDEILNEESQPGPMTRTVRTKTLTIPIMAIMRHPSPPTGDNFMPLPPPPSPFNQPPPPPSQSEEEEFTPQRLFFPQQQRFNQQQMDEEPEPGMNFQQSHSPMMYKHPMHHHGPDSTAHNPVFQQMFPRLPRK